MNPPYERREIGKWVRKAYHEARKGATVVCLLPARTDTRWWSSYCTRGDVRFIEGRVNFVDTGAKVKRHAPARFPSAIVIFHRHTTRSVKRMGKLSKKSCRPGWWWVFPPDNPGRNPKQLFLPWGEFGLAAIKGRDPRI